MNQLKWLKNIPLVTMPILALVVYYILPESELNHPARIAAASAVLMAGWWLTEAIPIPATAMIPLVLFPLAGVAPIRNAASSYADPLIFLFMGGLMMAQAMQRWQLHRRFAFRTILIMGTKPEFLILGFMVVSAFLSMWVSNTATVVMMLPIAMSIISLLESNRARDAISVTQEDCRKFALALLLGLAYGASIGGIGTLIGSPPNALFAGFLARQYQRTISFGDWLMIGLPVTMLFLPIAWAFLCFVRFRFSFREIPGGRKIFADGLKDLGPLSSVEMRILGVFLLVDLLWIFHPLLAKWWSYSGFHDASIAMGGALLFFILPAKEFSGERILNWQFAKNIPWDVLVLFGGGLSLATALSDTGLSLYLGSKLHLLKDLSPLLICAVVTFCVVFVTELVSNTALIATLLPVLAAVSVATGIHPYLLLLPATVASSYAFMLPVGTPPNALVFSSGHVTVREMSRTGIWLNLLGILILTLYIYFVAGPLLGEDFSVFPLWAKSQSP